MSNLYSNSIIREQSAPLLLSQPCNQNQSIGCVMTIYHVPCIYVYTVYMYTKLHIFFTIMYIGFYVFLEILGVCCWYITYPVYMYIKYICKQNIHIFNHHAYRFIRISLDIGCVLPIYHVPCIYVYKVYMCTKYKYSLS